MIVAPLVVYEFIKFWFPLISGAGLIIKAYLTAKKNIGDWAGKLLDNHLAHIEQATNQTNELLIKAATQSEQTAERLEDHHDKQLQVWESVARTLAILQDRQDHPRAARARKR